MTLDVAVVVSGTGLLIGAGAVVIIATAPHHASAPPQKATFSWVDSSSEPGGSATPSPARPNRP